MNSTQQKWVLMPTGAEYSTDYDFFLGNQITVISSRTGTAFMSRLDGSIFLRTPKRKLSEDLITYFIRLIHRGICQLKYGGKIVN